ncbi:hypothetical protein McanMca71_002398 [Microsporum canis]
MTSALGERSTDASKSEVTTEIPQSASARQSRPYKYCITLLVILIPALYYLYRDRLPWHKGQYPYRPDNDDRYWTLDHPPKDQEPEPFYPIKRYSLEYRGYVACWQHQGVWVGYLTPVEMSHLGVDRFRDSERSLDQVEEDAFCARLRLYGASFWSLPPQWPEGILWASSIDGVVEPTTKVNLTVGFPESGGVWFVDTSDGWEGLHPQRMGLYNAITMEERCNVLKDLGGKFCQDIQTCPEMAPLLAPPEAWIGV